MPKFSVSVEKRLYTTATVEVEADNENEAVIKVQSQIDSGELQSSSLDYGEYEYEDGSFTTTGDVE